MVPLWTLTPARPPLGLLLAALAVGCAGPRKLLYEPDELRAELRRRVPELGDRVEVPFDVTPAQIERARALTGAIATPSGRAKALLEAIRDPEGFGLRYEPARSSTAAQTLTDRAGNCLSLASVVVGLGRALGLQAYYVDVSDRIQDVLRHGDLTVRSGHVTAIIRTETGFAALDVGGRSLTTRGYWMAMDDLTAAAHLYNNRGYELIRAALERGAPIPWAEVREQFRLATRVRPEFAPAWHNLGVAHHRLGEPEAARAAFARAAALEGAASESGRR